MIDLTLALELIKCFEGFRAKPYLCPAGIPTIGFGSTYYEDGRKVTLNDPEITEARAKSLLEQFVTKEILPQVLRTCPRLDQNNKALNAIVDFCYNMGCGKFKSSTLAIMVNAEDWEKVREQLKLWVHSGGQVLPGLVKRREAEAALLPEK